MRGECTGTLKCTNRCVSLYGRNTMLRREKLSLNNYNRFYDFYEGIKRGRRGNAGIIDELASTQRPNTTCGGQRRTLVNLSDPFYPRFPGFMRRCTQSRRNLCIDGKNDLLLLLLFSSFRAFFLATHVCEAKITADVIFSPFVEPSSSSGEESGSCVTRVPSEFTRVYSLDCGRGLRNEVKLESRSDDDDPSKMEEGGAEGRGAARLSFLMSIGSDSLLNAAMISRSGRGRTRVSSAGSRDRDSIRGDVGWLVGWLLGFSPPTSVCDNSCY